MKDVRGGYQEKYGFHDSEAAYAFKSQKGLNADIVRQISEMKGEPGWMTDFRLKAYEIFLSKPMPTWGADLSGIDYDDIYYYVRAADRQGKSWDDVPEDI
ncbi:MAG: Fe-S cluster assembly protein SufB, partial [Blastochloris sp.]|nr:Fe-S cluster assembly protein SufB [Blastochloris sp.]